MSTNGLEKTSSANTKYKDGVFRQLFNDKEKAIELYNALTGADYDMTVDFEFTTLNPAISLEVKNDLAFTIDNRFVVFVEHQSTWSPNIPVRSLVYLGNTFDILYNNTSIYSRTPKVIPTPEFYVLYNGHDKKDIPDLLRLTDLFAGASRENSVELVVKIINICYNEDDIILKKSRTLYEYSVFVELFRQNRKKYNNLNDAMQATVDECINRDILAEYLQKQGVDELSLLYRGITMEEYGDVREDDGIEIAAHIVKASNAGVLIPQIAKELNLTEERVEYILEKFK